MDYRLPQGHNLLDKIDLEGGGPCTATRPEAVEGVVIGHGGGEAAVENHCHRLPNHFQEAYVAVVPSPFRDQDHHLPDCLLQEDSIPDSIYTNSTTISQFVGSRPFSPSSLLS